MPLSQIEILHQDDALLVINKPTLLLSVPGRAEDNRDCLVTRLQDNGYPEARIVHRTVAPIPRPRDREGLYRPVLGRAATRQRTHRTAAALRSADQATARGRP